MVVELLKPQDVAKITRLSLPFVYKLIAESKLPHIKIGRSLRVQQDDLAEFIRQRRRSTR